MHAHEIMFSTGPAHGLLGLAVVVSLAQTENKWHQKKDMAHLESLDSLVALSFSVFYVHAVNYKKVE